MDKETYELDVFCQNCNFEGSVSIPKGIVLADTTCSNCGTKMLEKKQKVLRMIPRREDYR